ncbi:uncharacterized protein LAJ45_00412 [Morchella importuna]|uniref:SYO1-like TPR repeats domain-containing protein n=1 Tax=Morchella conica CCBAS932 TaxID=1392247 RepID=A0A3N4KJ71_9PEZI|nr:uncharacterized protein LAJ45_00412 [Morchella importuna]KAH8155402.1 hypothetical protein LAJ45_00412 [Morchella importuna]RPB10570.1 hypothetical protein P167DRAFT_525584 [Morchella conica CCBAS932]
MGKAKKSRSSMARAIASPTARPLNPAEVAANAALRESKIIPVVKNLGSTNTKQRSEALSAIVNLLEDSNCRNLLLRERVVQKIMEGSLNDSNQEVVVYGWGALRNVAAEEGYDQCIFMYRKDILTPVAAAITIITTAIGNITNNPSALSTPEKKLLWQYTENVIGLITSLCETSQEVVDAITKISHLLHFLISILYPSQIIPSGVQEAAAQCLHALTEENVVIVEQIIENENYVSLLLKLKDDIQPEAAIKTIFVCGTLHNISLATPDTHQISDSLTLPTLTNLVRIASTPQDPEDISLTPLSLTPDQRILAVETALEILASIATAVQSNDENEFKADADGDVELGDEEGPEDIDEDVLADMDNVVGAESGGIDDMDGSAEDILAYLLTSTAQLLLPLAQGGNGSPLALQTRAISVLNNIAWTANVTIPPDSSLWGTWEKLAYAIWDEVVVKILRANTADIELADAISGLAWAVAKGTHGKVNIEGGVVGAFIALYGAARGAGGKAVAGVDGLEGKCVGVLGCLAMAEGRLDVNKEIGVFLMTLIAAAPNTPAEPTVEAINAIMDIYADADFDYDGPVFVNCGFLAHLQKALPNVRTIVKRIDKKKFPDDRHRADEAVLNMQRFIMYKTKERS